MAAWLPASICLFVFAELVQVAVGSRLALGSLTSATGGTAQDGAPPPAFVLAAACTGCSECAPVEDRTIFGRKEDYVFECTLCPDGSVLVDGPPAGFQSPEGVRVGVRSHCAKMGGEVKQVLMLRHGQSRWNEVMESSHKVAGVAGMSSSWKDSPLSGLGLRQAQRLATILAKADAAVHPDDQPNIPQSLQGAVDEYGYTDLEARVLIKHSPEDSGHSALSDAEAVAQLAAHPEELDVLTGRKCSETSFVSSQLVRAMDTLLIATMPSRTRCDADWEISSNMQEIEHNADCDARAAPGQHPVSNPFQEKAYIQNQMTSTLQYVGARYAASNTSRFTKNYDKLERVRLFDHTEQLAGEAAHVFRSGKKYAVWGGHSIWFRQFFKAFGDRQDPTCKELMKVKMANTGLVSAQLRELPGETQRYVVTKCQYVYLGSSGNYKFAIDEKVHTTHVPVPVDFHRHVKQIMGWKCCCSRPEYEGFQPGSRFDPYPRPAFFGGCLIVHAAKCKDTTTWTKVDGMLAHRLASSARSFVWRSSFGSGPGMCE